MDQLRNWAARLRGEVSSGEILCPGPGHSLRDRSLSVRPDEKSPWGFWIYSFAGDDLRECQDHVSRLLGVERRSPKRAQPICKVTLGHPDGNQPLGRRDLALGLWDEARPPDDTIGATYLAKRSGRPLTWPADLRFHPQCPRDGGTKIERLPAVVALLRDIHTDEPRAVQRIFLKADGSDRLRDAMGKMTLGPSAGCACKLSPDENVTYGLGIIEGIEKGLALLGIGRSPIWATCGTPGMSSFPTLAGIDTLEIFADNDVPGRQAAQQCGLRWARAGKAARMITPKTIGADWSDMLEAV